MPTPLQIDLFGVACVFALAGLVACLVRRVRLAEGGQRELYCQLKRVQRAARVYHARLKNPHRFADPEKEFVRVLDRDGKPVTLAFTDAGFTQAKLRGLHIEGLIKSGEAEVIE